jgi:O-antigen/teichoic acid export membrane protein
MTQALKTFLAGNSFCQPLVAHWRGNRLFRSVATIAGGTVFAQGLSLLSSPITTRLYGPADYGTVAVFTSAVATLLLLATWRYEMAIVLPKSDEDARSVLWCCLLLSCCVSVLTVVGFFFFGHWLFDVLKVPQLYRFWWMLPPTLLGASLYQCFSIWALRRKAYSDVSKSKVRQAIAGTSVTLAIGSLWKGPLGLLLGSFCSMSMGVRRLSRGSSWLERGVGLSAVLRRAYQALRAYGKFSVLTTVSTLLANIGAFLAPIVFAAFYSGTMVGHFSLAQRLVFLPSTLLGTAVAQVFVAEASDILRTRPEEMPHFFRKITRQMAPLGACILVVGAFCPWVFPLAFGARWQTAGVFAAVLSVLAAVQIVVGPISDISILRKRMDVQLGLGVLRAIMILTSIWLPGYLGWSPLMAVVSYTIGTSLINFISFYCYQRIARHIHPVEAPAPAEVGA